MKNNRFISQISLFFSSVLLFVLSNSNLIFKEGIGFLSFFVYLPILFLIKKSSLKIAWVWGIAYGVIANGIYAYWLYNFHPLGLYIVCIGYGLFFAFVFTGLKLIDKCFATKSWIVQFLFICSFEYLKTLGFAGLSYGVSAYTMWKYIYLIQIVDTIGIFGLNLIVIFPSFFIYALVTKKCKYLLGIIWIALFVLINIYGIIDVKKGNPSKYTTVIAIQNNERPWKNGIEEYKSNVEKLINLTNEAIKNNPEADFVVWPETAIAPSILANYYEKEDFKRYDLIYNLLKYINGQKQVFVIGNANQQNLKDGTVERYNSSFVFVPGINVIPPEPYIYSKIKLVPFTETFPYKVQFPNLYEKLLNGDTHMWESGSEYSVFEIKDLSFSTPICFEDTFGYVCRNMVNNGSKALINLSNDAWSKSKVCQNQHLAMAVFRSVENRVPSVRSTASGETCIINQHGKIIEMAPSFEESYIAGKIPVYGNNFKKSFYSKTGDWAGILEVLITGVILIIQIIRVIILKTNNKSA